MPDMSTSLPDGTTAINRDRSQRMVVRNGTWVSDTSYRPPAPSGPVLSSAKTSADDRKALLAATNKATAERDALRTYGDALKAVDTFGTGPSKGAFFRAITPDDEGGFWDTVGALAGSIPRVFIGQDTLDAYDHLRTVNAKTAIDNSAALKGPATDKDMALLRLAGVGPMRTVKENKRIVNEAIRTSGLEQARAMVTSDWIARFGSLAQPSPKGITYERALRIAEDHYTQNYAKRSSLPKAPPSVKGRTPVTIDINGNVVR